MHHSFSLASIKQIELLAPARDYLTGIAAINHGADAVYIGYSRFGAREAAGNSLVDIEKLIYYAHLFHAKVYITLNTILYENELNEVEKLIHTFYNLGADAIIVQDLGILEMSLPPIPLHASTQTNNVEVEKIKFLEDVGFQRVILARELTINEIHEIRKQTKVELEAFIHGALCVSYSGQCYFSQAIAGKSANRGACAQPCRSSYDLVDEDGKVLVKNKHLLSLRDNNQTQNIGELIDAGVSSFKIEGRLKDIDYVKNITAHYRKLIDRILVNRKEFKKASSGKVTFNFEPDPERTFNRSYTDYFAHGRQNDQASHNTQKSVGKPIGSVTSVSDNWFTVSSTENLNNGDGLCFFNRDGILAGIKVNRVDGSKIFPLKMNEIFKGAFVFRNFDKAFEKLLNENSAERRVVCKIKVEVEDSNVKFEMIDDDSITTIISFAYAFNKAKNSETVIENISKQLSKSGDTIYSVKSVSVDITSKETPFFAISQLNGWRRELFEKHNENRISAHFRPNTQIIPNSVQYPEKDLDYRANVSNPLAKKFYQRHGVEKIDDAFELQNIPEGQQIMVTRYCILHELGHCNGNGKNRLAGKKLFLRDNNHSYPLVFDCRNCRMKIMTPR